MDNLQSSQKSVSLQCVFHSIRFKVNKGWSKALLLFLCPYVSYWTFVYSRITLFFSRFAVTLEKDTFRLYPEYINQKVLFLRYISRSNFNPDKTMKTERKYHHLIKSVIIVLFLSFGMTSCEKEEPVPVPTEQTVFMYLPWSDNLTSNFYQNISDLESVVEKNILKDERIIIFMCTTATKATLFELAYENGKSVHKTLKNYTDPAYTTAEGITSILNDVQRYSPTKRYSMVIGCHGMGWIPVSNSKSRSGLRTKMHWEYENVPMTRYFGGLNAQYQTDITTLAKGISNAGLKMEYILFDDCYMSSIEVAYALKDVTDYLIGSTSEVMAYGMPYAEIGQYLIGKVDYAGICDGFYSFYSTYSTPCGTIAVTDCSELDNLATIMKEINHRYTFDPSLTSSLQRLDGYYPVIFFDYGDYVSKLCPDETLVARFNEQLNRTVPFKRNTEYFYSMSRGEVKINTFSGITISDPSTHSLASKKEETAWYAATH